MQLKKEVVKKFDHNDKYMIIDTAARNATFQTASPSSSQHFSHSLEEESPSIASSPLSTPMQTLRKLKVVNFLHFSNKTSSSLLDESQTKALLYSSTPESFSNFLKSNFNLIKKTNLDSFKSTFQVLSKLNKSINIFNGNYLNIDEKNYLDHFLSFFNVNASQFDLNGLLYNLNKRFNVDSLSSSYSSSHQNISKTISLCSNIYDKVRIIINCF